MKKKQPEYIFVIWLLAAVFLFVPRQAFPQNKVERAPVIIGAPLPFSGGLQNVASVIKNSMEMAKDAVNATGGINGHLLKIEYANDGGEIALGEKAIKKLTTQSKAAMLVGGYRSNSTFHMAALAEAMEIPFLICGAAADNITQQGWKNIFRINIPVSEYALSMEDFWIRHVKPQSMAIIYENSMYGTDGATNMMGFCRDNRIQVTNIISYDRKKTSANYFQNLIAPLGTSRPDIIYMLSELEDGVALVKAIKTLNLKALLCGGGAGFTQNEFIEKAGPAANFLLTSALWNGQLHYPQSIAFSEHYQKRFGKDPDYHGAQAYSAVMVAADALKHSLSFDADSIRASLDRTFLHTPIGPVKFYNYANFQRQNSIRTQVLQIFAGKFEVVWPLDLSTSPFIPPPK